MFTTDRKEIAMARLITLTITLLVLASTFAPFALAGGKLP